MIHARRIVRIIIFLLFAFYTSFLLGAETVSQLANKLGLQMFEPGVEAPDFELDFLDGERRALSSYRGKVVFLNFWATWCPPCRQEMPSMQELYQRYSNAGLVVIAVDLQESVETVRNFVNDFKLTFPVALDSNGRVAAMYGARSIPTTYIIDRNGMVLAGAIGARDWASDDSYRYFDTILED